MQNTSTWESIHRDLYLLDASVTLDLLSQSTAVSACGSYSRTDIHIDRYQVTPRTDYPLTTVATIEDGKANAQL